jgi:PEP-CTERM motif
VIPPRWFRLEGLALCALAIALMLAVATPAHAGVLYSTGFENPPFTLGNLSGQDGWVAFVPVSTVLVENTLVQSGLQAVSVDGSGLYGAFHSDFSTGPLLQLSAGIYIASSSTHSEWWFTGQDPNLAAFLGGIKILNTGQIEAFTAGFPVVGTFTYDTWNNVSFLFNITTQTYSITLNGVVVDSSAPFCGDNGGCGGAHVSSYGNGLFLTLGGGNDTGYIDNYKVVENPSSTPEPSSFALFGTGILGVAGVLRRRLKL